jgi:hypothetical protein
VFLRLLMDFFNEYGFHLMFDLADRKLSYKPLSIYYIDIGFGVCIYLMCKIVKGQSFSYFSVMNVLEGN